MMKLTKKLHKDQKGLTLIELLAVIVILGIIAAIAIPSVNSIIKNSEARAQTANAKLIISTARLAIADRSFEGIGEEVDITTLPASKVENGVETKVPNLPNADWDRFARKITLNELLEKGYLDKNLKDPQTHNPYLNDDSYVIVVMDQKIDSPGEYQVQWHYLIKLVGTLLEDTQNITDKDKKVYYDVINELAL